MDYQILNSIINYEFSIELAMDLYESQDLFPVDFDDAWKWIGWNQKQTGKNVLLNNFDEGLDFLGKGMKSPSGGRPSEFIVLTIDCFKSLAMMAGTSKGREVRRYFLDCEKVAKQKTHQIPQSYSEALLEAGRLAQENEKLTAQIKQSAPLVNYAQQVKLTDDLIDFNTFAKSLRWGRNRLMAKLRDLNILIKDSTLPYQQYCDRGYFEVKQEINNGRLYHYAVITGKGQIWLKNKLDESEQLKIAVANSILNNVLAL